MFYNLIVYKMRNIEDGARRCCAFFEHGGEIEKYTCKYVRSDKLSSCRCILFFLSRALTRGFDVRHSTVKVSSHGTPLDVYDWPIIVRLAASLNKRAAVEPNNPTNGDSRRAVH